MHDRSLSSLPSLPPQPGGCGALVGPGAGPAMFKPLTSHVHSGTTRNRASGSGRPRTSNGASGFRQGLPRTSYGALGMRRWHAGGVISRRVSPVFVGRETEIETLVGALDEAAGGMPGTVLLGAEAGGGKSRLVAEFTARVRDRATVVAGGCVDLGA